MRDSEEERGFGCTGPLNHGPLFSRVWVGKCQERYLRFFLACSGQFLLSKAEPIMQALQGRFRVLGLIRVLGEAACLKFVEFLKQSARR